MKKLPPLIVAVLVISLCTISPTATGFSSLSESGGAIGDCIRKAPPRLGLINIDEISYDPPGVDHSSRRKLNKEFVSVENSGTRTVDMTGWTLRDSDRHVFVFPSFRLEPGKTVRVHTGRGEALATDLFWGSKRFIWNNSGDSASLENGSGTLASRCSFPDMPDPRDGHEAFDIFFIEVGSPPQAVIYDTMTFAESDGWDFGDRNAYNCAWAEYYQGRDERFEVHFERIQTYDPGILVNDRFGAEAPDIPAGIGGLCGDGVPGENGPTWDDTDHFPHGTALTFHEGGMEIASLDLHRDECSKGYWVPGDEPGEAWLWWDADGPTNDGHHDLMCDGGLGEPVAVLRMTVQSVDAGIDYCIEDPLDGDLCTGVTAPVAARHD